MYFMNGFTHLVVASTTSTTTKNTNTGGSYFLFVIIALFAVLYFVMIRPNQRRRMQAMRQARSFDLGDEVVAGGMVGRVVRIGEGEVDVEVADGVVVQFMRQAVQARASYMAGPAGRGAGAGRAGGMGGGGMGGGFGGGGFGAGGAGSNGSGANVGSRARSVRRRADASDAWPEAGDIPGGGTAGGTGATGGGAPSTGEK